MTPCRVTLKRTYYADNQGQNAGGIADRKFALISTCRSPNQSTDFQLSITTPVMVGTVLSRRTFAVEDAM